MLAELIATRIVPIPIRKKYGDQFVAATTTFTCIALTRNAAAITTSPTIQQSLILSTPGHDAILDQLNLTYYQIINQYSTDLPDYLSQRISNVIDIVIVLKAILHTLPEATSSKPFLINLQQRLDID